MTQPRDDSVPPLPVTEEPSEALDNLRKSRHEAVQAMLVAEAAEREARNHRSYAKRLLKAYERDLMEYNGQLRLGD